MVLDIFSYRADSSGTGQQQPSCLAKTSSIPPNQVVGPGFHDELKQMPWNQINIPGPLKSDGQRLLGPMKVPGDPIRSPTPSRRKDFALASTAVDGQYNPIYMDTDLFLTLSNNEPRFRCFNHDCGGRTFSCAENYRRHIRERESSAKIYCTFCQVSFTRRSNLRKHVSERKCRVLKPCQTHGKASSSRSSNVFL